MAHIGLKSIGFLFNNNLHYLRSQSYSNCKDVMKEGYLVVQKNMKKYYFVLRKEISETRPSRLEYYNSEYKFLCGYEPKKTYILKECFYITQKRDKKKFVIVLYINKTCVGLVCKTEDDLKLWLEELKLYKGAPEDIKPSMTDYEHVWPVEVVARSSLRSCPSLLGHHWLCFFANRVLSLIRSDNLQIKKAFQFNTIRKCGFEDKLFYLKVGRYSVTGEGVLYMKAESYFVAKKIHSIIGSAMLNFKRTPPTAEDSGSKKRAPPTDKQTYGKSCPEDSSSRPSSDFASHLSSQGRCRPPDPEDIELQQIYEQNERSPDEADTVLLIPDRRDSDYDKEFSSRLPNGASVDPEDAGKPTNTRPVSLKTSNASSSCGNYLWMRAGKIRSSLTADHTLDLSPSTESTTSSFPRDLGSPQSMFDDEYVLIWPETEEVSHVSQADSPVSPVSQGRLEEEEVSPYLDMTTRLLVD